MNLFWAVLTVVVVVLICLLLVLAIGYELGWRGALRQGRKARGSLAKDVREQMELHPMEDVHGDVPSVPFEGQVR